MGPVGEFERGYDWWSFVARQEGGRKPVNRVRYAYEVARDYVLIGVVAGLVCRARGHRISVTSDIGPDHGIEWHECTRCWRSWDHVYY